MAERDGWSPPNEFDEYRLIRRLGRGGMGEVFLAHDTLLDRPVAVKFVASVSTDASSYERLLVEARAAARLQHPNVVAVYRVGDLERRPYIISEYIRGQSLDRLEKPLPWERVLALGIGLARGLAAAHRRGVLHRDIKPANAIIAEDGEVKLLDFGLAKLTEVAELPTTRAPTAAIADGSNAEPVAPPGALALAGAAAGAAPETIRLVPVAAVPAVSAPQPGAAPDATPDAAQGSNGALAPTLRETLLAPVQALANSLEGASGKLTRAGVVMGTPDYMPPEVFRGEPANRRSDVYSLGALLFELCAGASPFHEIPNKDLPHHLQQHDAPPLLTVAPTVEARFAEIVDRCLARQPGRRFASADELRDALEQLTPAARPSAIPEGNPYRGLAPFEAEHRALFFGRSGAIRGVLDRLRTEPFVLVAGDSGVGKSSLCRAGVLPAVEHGGLEDARGWRVLPLVPGRRPVTALAAGLAGVVDVDEDEIAKVIRRDAPRAAQIVRKALGPDGGLVLFVDQLEELLTLSEPDDASAMATALAELGAGVPGVRLLATVRGDFLTRLAALPDLGDEVSRALYLLRPLGPEAMREAIVGPAQAKGFRFESDALVEAVVRSSQRAEGGLPLLQFALAELWEARDEQTRSITAEALVRISGVEGALERHADGVIAALLPAQRAAARRILTRLVTLEGTRARRTETELGASDPGMRAALDALVRGRLLVPRDVGDGTTAYEVAHEALLTGWRTLRGWLDEQVEQRAGKNRIEAAAAEWERAAHAPDALWNARRLVEIGVLDATDLSPRELAFIAASRRAVRRGRVLRIVSAAGVLALVVAMYVGLRLKQAHDTDREVTSRLRDARAVYDATLRRHDDLGALRKHAYARFDANGDDSERLWDEARTLSGELDRDYGMASEALEAAIHRGGHNRTDVRALMADVLLERARLADEDHDPDTRDELLRRLAVYDEDGERRARWATPAHLTLTTSPALDGTTIVLHRINIDAKTRRRQVDETSPVASGGAALAAVTLPPASYVATIEARGRAPVTVPLLLERAAAIRIDVPLLPASLPTGFVYVPAGEFLFGAADEALRRQFHYTAPLHPRTTEAFFISLTETTYADWIAYLEVLPAGPERDARLPKSGTAGLQGALALEAAPDGGWRLTIQPTTSASTLAVGEPLVYAARERRREQDWRRLPVSGISAADAEAYVVWLDRSGRVPGARLCTELEWERAARGADDRRFPNGDELAPDDANLQPTYGTDPATRGPDEVGAHPASRSPFGVDDMAGNVWEWVRSAAHSDEYLVRGGAYAFEAVASVSYAREMVGEPSFRDITLGVRICATPGAASGR